MDAPSRHRGASKCTELPPAARAVHQQCKQVTAQLSRERTDYLCKFQLEVLSRLDCLQCVLLRSQALSPLRCYQSVRARQGAHKESFRKYGQVGSQPRVHTQQDCYATSTSNKPFHSGGCPGCHTVSKGRSCWLAAKRVCPAVNFFADVPAYQRADRLPRAGQPHPPPGTRTGAACAPRGPRSRARQPRGG
jgi:hypothetical protein